MPLHSASGIQWLKWDMQKHSTTLEQCMPVASAHLKIILKRSSDIFLLPSKVMQSSNIILA